MTRQQVQALTLFGTSAGFSVIALITTIQAFAPRLAQVVNETEHLPELAIALVLTIGVLHLLKLLLE